MPVVTMPDGTDVSFPDEMPREQIRDMIASKFPELQNQPSSSGLERFAQGFIDTATFGFGDEIEAGLRSTFTSEGYDEALKDVQERQQGLSYYGGMLPGLAVPGLGAVKGIQKATSGVGKLATGAAIGAAEGGLAGAGFADSGERLEGAGVGAAIGAPLGVIGGTVADMIRPSTKAITSKIGIDDIPLPQAKEEISEGIKSAASKLDDAAKNAWQNVEQIGGEFQVPGVSAIVRNTLKATVRNQPDFEVEEIGEKILRKVIPEKLDTKNLGLEDLARIRTKINANYTAGNNVKNRAVRVLREKLDEDIVKLTTSPFYRGFPGEDKLVQKAVNATKKYKRFFEEDKILKALVDDNASPDQALNFLFNVNSVTRNKNAVSSLRKIQEVSPKTFEALKQAGWQRITTHADGRPRDAKDVARFINEMNLNNNQLSKKLFEKDWEKIRKLPEQLKRSSDNSNYRQLAAKFSRPLAFALSGTPAAGAAWFASDLLR